MKRLFLSLLVVAIAVACSPVNQPYASQTSNETTVTSNGQSSAQIVYNNMLKEHAAVGEQIGFLGAELNSASKSQAKKINKEIGVLTDQLASLERRMSAFPQSIRNPNSVNQTPVKDNSFRTTMDSVIDLRIAATDPYAGKLSDDPELDKLYREYLKSGQPLPEMNADGSIVEPKVSDKQQERVYRVMIITSKKQLSPTTFGGLDGVFEQKISATAGYAYYKGSYSTRSEAQKACDKIIKAGKFKKASVVAMVGNERVQ